MFIRVYYPNILSVIDFKNMGIPNPININKARTELINHETADTLKSNNTETVIINNDMNSVENIFNFRNSMVFLF
jgi:hypothetical protein